MCVPFITDNYRTLFIPEHSGYYINDHTIFQDAYGNWQLIGITSKTDGNPDAEKYFAVASSKTFPPNDIMKEESPVADVGELAWAPHVIKHKNIYHMFWSPHKLHHMTSTDGIRWGNHDVIMEKPYHKFFRDCMILQVAKDQWLLYTTARGTFFSQIDVYQSFNLTQWQYIRTALQSSWGSERNSPALITTLKAHAPEWIYVPQTKQWYITTCGWKWVATLTNGEAAIAPVSWKCKK